MARGVSTNFLELARREQRLGQRAAIAALILAPIGAFFADLSDDPGYGPMWAWFVVTCVLGLALGIVLTHRRLGRYEDGLRVKWNHWMRQAITAHRIADVERMVGERDPPPPYLAEAGVGLLLALNAILFALLWVANPGAQSLAVLVVAADGLVLGVLITTSAMLTRWARDFVQAAEELMQHGEVPVWGER